MPVVPGGAAIIAEKKAKELQHKFTEKGAISPETALTIEELGIKRKTAIFELMILRKHIIEAGDKYYFDNEKFDDRAMKRLKDFVIGLFAESKE